MRRTLLIFNWLHLVSLAFWVGGMFLLGILVEIMVRINLKEQPLVASKIMNKIMDVFNVNIIYTCIAIILITEALKFLAGKWKSGGYEKQVVTKKEYTREVFLAVMIVLAIYIGGVLRPEMHEVDKLKKESPESKKLQIQFDRYHQKLTWFYTVNMILGLSCFYIHGKEMMRFRDE